MQVSENAFLDGRLTITQPLSGYRAGVDPVFLAASVPARAGQSVLELGCGVGTASLCLGWRVSDLELSGVELQVPYADLAKANAQRNNQTLQVVSADLSALPDELKQRQFDHVIANPPYFDRTASTAARDSGREIALGENTPLAVWVDTASRRLVSKGYATFIHRAERLPDLLFAMSGRLGSVQVLPLQPRIGRDANLVLVRARKGGRADFRLHAPVLLHDGAHHESDRESYTPAIRDVLRHGKALPFPA